jgi:hypothetical protein
MRFYRISAIVLAVAFAAVGLVFLLAPGVVSSVFEWMGRWMGIQGMPAGDPDSGLFRALAVAYMYGVTLLAWMMFRRPTEPMWPALLAQAKLASASVSFLLFALHEPYLVYAANGVVDGVIGVMVLLLRRQVMRRGGAATGGAR